MELVWQRYDWFLLQEALKNYYCLYVLHHQKDGDRPFYIGKAKHLGRRYKNNRHMLEAMSRSGYSLYVASIGEASFIWAEHWEQELIALWKPISKQKKIGHMRLPVITEKPWRLTYSPFGRLKLKKD